MDCMLETRGLTKRFGRGEGACAAVADVDLHVERGPSTACSVPTEPANRPP